MVTPHHTAACALFIQQATTAPHSYLSKIWQNSHIYYDNIVIIFLKIPPESCMADGKQLCDWLVLKHGQVSEQTWTPSKPKGQITFRLHYTWLFCYLHAPHQALNANGRTLLYSIYILHHQYNVECEMNTEIQAPAMPLKPDTSFIPSTELLSAWVRCRKYFQLRLIVCSL